MSIVAIQQQKKVGSTDTIFLVKTSAGTIRKIICVTWDNLAEFPGRHVTSGFNAITCFSKEEVLVAVELLAEEVANYYGDELH